MLFCRPGGCPVSDFLTTLWVAVLAAKELIITPTSISMSLSHGNVVFSKDSASHMTILHQFLKHFTMQKLTLPFKKLTFQGTNAIPFSMKTFVSKLRTLDEINLAEWRTTTAILPCNFPKLLQNNKNLQQVTRIPSPLGLLTLPLQHLYRLKHIRVRIGQSCYAGPRFIEGNADYDFHFGDESAFNQTHLVVSGFNPQKLHEAFANTPYTHQIASLSWSITDFDIPYGSWDSILPHITNLPNTFPLVKRAEITILQRFGYAKEECSNINDVYDYLWTLLEPLCDVFDAMRTRLLDLDFVQRMSFQVDLDFEEPEFTVQVIATALLHKLVACIAETKLSDTSVTALVHLSSTQTLALEVTCSAEHYTPACDKTVG